MLVIGNAGTIAYDLRVVVENTSSELCPGEGDLELELKLASADLCEVLGDPDGILVTSDLAPGAADVPIDVTATLADDALYSWSVLSDEFRLDIQGRQHGSDQGFSDFAKGLLTVTIGDFAPDVEVFDECPLAIGDFRSYHVLGNGNHDLDLSDEVGPALVVAGNGSKDIIGTPQEDCILVRNGNNNVDGGGGDDVIVARNGNNDVLSGGAGNDLIIAGNGNVHLYGGAGADTLIAGNGNTSLDGGRGQDHCEAGNGNIDPISCETVLTGLRAGVLSAPGSDPSSDDSTGRLPSTVTPEDSPDGPPSDGTKSEPIEESGLVLGRSSEGPPPPHVVPTPPEQLTADIEATSPREPDPERAPPTLDE